MKIIKITYENFRNFKEAGEIKFSTDGKATIIYGKNGDGKTTLHQLFQWIFYGKVNFNKTTTDRLYNLQFEREYPYGETFTVMGSIDFEHENKVYSLTRKYTYRKDIEETKKISEDLTLYIDNDNYDKLDNPKEIIEKILPSGLSEYFFFDGESMIADLRLKGAESAEKLKKALFAMFNLDIIDSALNHIGRTDLRTTVLGRLYLKKGYDKNQKPLNQQIAETEKNIHLAESKLDEIDKELIDAKTEKKQLTNFIEKISEEIGTNKSKKDYEVKRKELQNDRDQFDEIAKNTLSSFGNTINTLVPQILIAKAISNANLNFYLDVDKNELPKGLSHTLIEFLLSGSTKQCICGHQLTEKEQAHIKTYLKLLPPYSIANLYQHFCTTIENWKNTYTDDYKKTIEKHIIDYLKYSEIASKQDKLIKELDEDKKKALDIEELITQRQMAEKQISDKDALIIKKETDRKKYEIYRNKQMKEYDKLTQNNKENQKVQKQILIMEQIAKHFQKKLDIEKIKYSQKLQENIQALIDKMLTSKRTVSVTPKFSIEIKDSYDDESKSEGQFAVVSFAYIGGILKLLQNEHQLSEKKYPLVLDGPFSKLDPDQRQNVVNTIPEFAPQLIIFSKDDLHDVFQPEYIGKEWTIISNDEKNIAKVKEGYLWK